MSYSPEDLQRIFTYHAPEGDQPKAYETIRSAAKSLAEVVVNLSPESDERTMSINHIQAAVMWANAAIARQ